MAPRQRPLDLLQGTLDLLILRTLQKEPQHGWAIAERIEEVSEHVLEVNQGSLYPALHRLENRGLLDAVWKETTFVSPRSVDVYVRKLREKIESDPEQPRYLKTVRGTGYRFEAPK